MDGGEEEHTRSNHLNIKCFVLEAFCIFISALFNLFIYHFLSVADIEDNGMEMWSELRQLHTCHYLCIQVYKQMFPLRPT